jgi:bacillithiol synthase
LAKLPTEAASAAACLDGYKDADVGSAFARLLNQWLGGLGLVVAQSTDMRALSPELLARDLSEYETVSRLIQEAGLRMQQHGYKPGFAKSASAPHFFICAEPARVRAHVDPRPGGEFLERSVALAARQQEPRVYAVEALRNLIRSRPELFSTSASLRPVLQQKIFPVAAAVLGPGEIAYWAQLKRVHDHFDAVWPVVVPRATLTLIDGHGSKQLRKLGLQPGPEIFGDPRSLQQKLLPGGEVRSKVDQRAARILAEVDAMAAEVRAVNGGLNPLFEKARARIEHDLQRIAEKTQTALNEKEGVGQDRLRYLTNLVRPKNSPQDRVLSCAQFMALYPNLPAELLEVLDVSVREHLVVSLE